MIFLTRRYRFAAAHVLAQPAFPAERNREIYGKCANPAGHGHDYSVEVTVTGPVDPETGRIVAPATLDEIFSDTVLARFGHRMLNDQAPFGALVPTAENIARVVRDLLAEVVPKRSGARIAHVRVVETPRNAAEVGEFR